jgi:hypothetical protein
VGGASDPWEIRMEPGRATAVIEVPPGSGGRVITKRSGSAALRTSEGGIASMGEPEVDAAPVRVESNAPHPPGVIQSQEFREEGDVAHGRGARGRRLPAEGIGVPAILAPEHRRGKEVGVWVRELVSLVPPHMAQLCLS